MNTKQNIDNLNIEIKNILLSIMTNENGEYIEGFDYSILKEFLYYKPTSYSELIGIPFLSKVFKSLPKIEMNSIITTISKKISSFESINKNLIRIKPELRNAIEITNYRSISLEETNPLVFRPKIFNEDISLFNERNILFEGIISSVFAKNDKKHYIEYNDPFPTLDTIINLDIKTFNQDNIRRSYISFGKLTGTTKTNKKSIKFNAPVLFFPVLIENEEDEKGKVVWYFKYDQERDFKINIDALLAYNNVQRINTNINYSCFHKIVEMNEFNEEKILNLITLFYNENKIFMSKNQKNNTDLRITIDVTFGIYNIYKNTTQKDVEEILDNGFTTKNIIELYSKKESSFKIDEIAGNKNKEVEEKIKELQSERKYDVSFTTKINYPQENAIKAVNIHENIVIQGPPGTGKTETIVSIISDAILRDKKILVSSEKQVAIDVIKARMGELAKYAIIFSNNSDPAFLYSQLEFAISESVKDRKNQENTSLIMSDNEILFRRSEARKQIYDYMKDYHTIFQYLRSNEIGKTYSYLYQNHGSNRTDEPLIKKILDGSTITELIKSNNLFVPQLYDVLFLLNQKFSYKKNNSEFDLDKAILGKYPFLLTHTKPNIKLSDIDKVLNLLDHYSDSTFFIEGSYTNEAKKILKKIFIDVKHTSTYMKSLDEVKMVINALVQKIKQVDNSTDSTNPQDLYNSLGAAWMKLFNEITELFKEKRKKINSEMISNVIFDHTINQILYLKETSNSELQRNIYNGNISSFQKMISKSLQEIIEQNITLTGRKMRDSLLNTLVKSGKMLEIQSIVDNQKFLNINKFMNEYWNEVFNAINVWLLPAESVTNFFPLEPEMFDIVIIDEASQMLIEKSIPLMYRAKQLVISGDDKQLKPSVNTDNRVYFDPELVEWNETILPPFSLQDALKNKFPNFLLNYHYRSKYPELISFSNSFIYNKNLYVSTPSTPPLNDPAIQFKRCKTGKYSKGANTKEADLLIEEVKKLIKKDPSKTIGIITLNTKQREVIKDKLDEEAAKNSSLDLFIRTNSYSNNSEDTSLFVKNVSEVQGDERDIIIFSIGFAKQTDGSYPVDLGEISREHGENRLNVAITRAKEKIIVCASINPNDLSIEKGDVGGELLKHYLYYAEACEKNNTRLIKRILKINDISETKVFESKMHEEIYELLKENGYNIEYQYGFDDYKIDFVIKDEDKSIILGINLDNKQYLRNFNTMEREYYLPTYLEARGWNIIRVWSHQWSKDPIEENKRILEIIKKQINLFKSGGIISMLNGSGNLLDFNVEDDLISYYKDNEEEKIDESARLIEERYQSVKSMKKRILSDKREAEERRWLEEYKSLERQEYKLEDDINMIVHRDLKEDYKTKTIDGIEGEELKIMTMASEKKGESL